MFRWDIKPPTDAILAAQRRGATVLLVGDDDLRLNKQGRRLIATLEEQDPARRNVTICDGACLPWRAPGPYPDSQDVQHLKFYVTDIGGVQSFVTSLGQPRGPAVPPVQLVHQDRRPGPLPTSAWRTSPGWRHRA